MAKGEDITYWDQQQIDKKAAEEAAAAAAAANPPAPGKMGAAGKKIDDAWRPGVKQAQLIYNEGLPPLDPNNYLANTMANLNAPNPYTSQLGGFDPNNPALNQLGGFDPSNPYTAQLGGFDANNPALQGLQNFDPSNAFMGGIQNFDPNNPGIQNFGQFMPGNTNPYADQLFDISASKIRDQINSQFGASGQGSSSGNLNEQISKLGDYGAQFYGGIYDADMNRALQATQGMSDAYQNQNKLGLDALGLGASTDQNANALGLNARSAYATGTQAANQLGLDAVTGAQSGWADTSRLGLNALGMGVDAYGRQDDQRLNALGQAQSGAQASTSAAGAMLPGMLSQIQNQPYSNLSQYSNIVSQLTGSSPQQPQQQKSSGWDKLIGAASIGASLFEPISLTSDRRLKENIELVGTHKPTGLNVYHFNYIGSPRRYEGLMADEVERIDPRAVIVGDDGFQRVYYDRVGFEMKEIH